MNDQKHGGFDPYSGAKSGIGASGNRNLLILGGVVVVAMVVVVAILLTGGGSSKSDNADGKGTGAYAAAHALREQSAVSVEGQALPPYPEVQSVLAPVNDDPAVGQVPPKLTGQTFDESPLTIDPKDGHAKVVMFFAHWCPHCQNELPEIQKWIDEGNVPKGVDLYAVSTSVSAKQPNYPPSKWIAREGFAPPVLLDDADSHAAVGWGLTGFPYFVALNADGTVAQRGSGEVPIDQFNAMAQKLKVSPG